MRGNNFTRRLLVASQQGGRCCGLVATAEAPAVARLRSPVATLLIVGSPSLAVPKRAFFTCSGRPLLEGTTVGQQSSAASGSSAESPMDVAMRVNRLKKAHQTGAGATKKQVETEAWQILQGLGEDQINAADGKAVALLLNSWAYFAKYWERGKDGPAMAAGREEGDAAAAEQHATASATTTEGENK